MDHVLQFFQQLDNLVWGAPLLVLDRKSVV